MAGARRRFLILHNPSAGMARRGLFDAVCRHLKDDGAQLEVVTTSSWAMANQMVRDAAASQRFDAVVAAGGDSTINGVASALRGSSVPLGIVPVGTGNVIAEEIGFRRHSAGTVARYLMYGPVVPVRAGLVNGSPFYSMASAGFDARVLARFDPRCKRLIGKLAYASPILAELVKPLERLDVAIDGISMRCSWLIIAKSSRYGGPFRLTTQQTLQMPGLHAVVMDIDSCAAMLGVLLAIAAGRLDHHPAIRILACRSATVPFQPGLLTQCDGELLGATQLDIALDDRETGLIYPCR